MIVVLSVHDITITFNLLEANTYYQSKKILKSKATQTNELTFNKDAYRNREIEPDARASTSCHKVLVLIQNLLGVVAHPILVMYYICFFVNIVS